MTDPRNPGVHNNDVGMEPGTTFKRIRCPKCGKKKGNLGLHIPACDGSDDAGA